MARPLKMEAVKQRTVGVLEVFAAETVVPGVNEADCGINDFAAVLREVETTAYTGGEWFESVVAEVKQAADTRGWANAGRGLRGDLAAGGGLRDVPR